MSREVYKLNCRCGHTVEIPAGAPNEPQHDTCPLCGAVLLIDWRRSEPVREG